MDGDRHGDHAFSGSIPEVYDRYMVPLIFEVYAADISHRLASHRPTSVLEVAAGTGAVTRAMADRLPASVAVTATDLNQPMLDYAAAAGTSRPIAWRQADAMDLPFDDASFDAVVCQFGVMFLPDRPRGFAEIRRVLRPGGVFLFNVWDRIGENEFADVITDAVGALFPDDPPTFLARTPHGYHDAAVIRSDLALGGFAGPMRFDVLEARSRAETPRIPAVAYCQGSPLRNEIEARDPHGLTHATEAATAAIAARFGPAAVDGKIRGIVITAEMR